MQDDYKIKIKLEMEEASKISQNNIFVLSGEQVSDASPFYLKVNSIKPISSTSGVKKDFQKIFDALSYIFKNTASRIRFLSISFVYFLLHPSGIGAFFSRGWRLSLISRMLYGENKNGIAPHIDKLEAIGNYINEGVKLVFARVVYDFPKILILAAIGYDHYELFLDWVIFFYEQVADEETVRTFSSMVDETKVNLGIGISAQLFLYAVASLIITPAYKILEIQYAAKSISYKGFFLIKNLKNSFSLYKKYRFSTLSMYLWDILVSFLSFVVGFITIIILPFLYLFITPVYKLVFKHFPKAYGYGLLAKRMQANGDLPEIEPQSEPFLAK